VEQHATGRVHPKLVKDLGVQQRQENHLLEGRQILIQPADLQGNSSSTSNSNSSSSSMSVW
jgi:hypothetical protein